MLVIEPKGGLCNRMRALDAAISLSQVMDRKLYVIWNLNSTLNCRFEELFSVSDCFTRIIQFKSRRIIDKLSGECLKLFFSKCGQFIYDGDGGIEKLQRREHDNLKSFFEQNRYIYIKTCYRFYQNSQPFTDLQPRKYLQKIINSYVNDFGNVIGVHIRRADNKASINRSPTAGFIELMQREVDRNNDVKFFLATDSIQEEQQLKQLFPNKIITHEKSSLDRNNPLAIQDAIIDLYCLSQTRKLIGCSGSSFTTTASIIGQMETIIVQYKKLQDIVSNAK